MIKVKLVGATGYGGVGLIELLLRHPEIEISSLVAASETGKPISHFYPHLAGLCDKMVYSADDKEADREADVVVYSTPDGIGMQLAPEEVKKGRKILDYSGDFRFNSTELYAEYATRLGLDTSHKAPDLLKDSVYGLAELHREEISGASVVGNPGCYAVACTLGLAPAAREKMIENNHVICDGKTGISGAGKKPKPGFHYPEAYDNSYAYRLTGHQHVMEVERELSLLAHSDIRTTFTPQVIPMARGIMATLYGTLPQGVTQAKVLEAYQEFYRDQPFVRVSDTPSSTGHVRGSNFVNITVACDERTGTLRIISHIDNLVKGQAGSALQNLNIMFGLDEMTGLNLPGAHP
ncbi:MAG: N-acetyl-gamma-glutamyl-phosphate reductase [Thermodesulfobacteriota bacterium]